SFLAARLGGSTEGGGFDDFLSEDPVHELEAAADDAGAPEQGADLLRRCIGGDVEILGLESDEEIAASAADDIGVVALLVQYFADFDGVARDVAPIDAVLVARQALRAARRTRKQPADEVFYCLFQHGGYFRTLRPACP